MVEVYKTLINDSPHFDAGARVPSDMLPLDSDGTLFIDLSEKVWWKLLEK